MLFRGNAEDTIHLVIINSIELELETDLLKAPLRYAIFRTTCLTTPLIARQLQVARNRIAQRNKSHETILPNMTYLATGENVEEPCSTILNDFKQ